jgi:hypothetical protein
MLGASHLGLFASQTNLYDPYWTSVVLLLGFENTLADASLSSSTVIQSPGAIVYSTSTVKFDTASGFLNNLGAGLQITASTSSFYFGTGDFTIETWCYAPTAISPSGWGSTNVAVMDISQQQNDVLGGPSGFYLNTTSNATVRSYKIGVYDNTAMGFTVTNTVVATDTWNHIVTGRTGTTFYLGINGILQSVGTSSKNWFPYDVRIKHDFYNEQNYAVNFDEFRVTKGVWRYGTGSAYNIPTARFPRQ